LLGKRLIADVTTEDLRRLQAKFKARVHPKQKERRQWTNATINRHFAFLRHIFMLAVTDGKLQRNPVSGVKSLPEVKRTRFFSQEELDALRTHLADMHWKVVALAVETGLRRGEQFQLRWDQVDLENGVLTIPLPKGDKTRHVPLSEQALTILRSLDSFLLSPWVFPSPKAPLKHWNAQSFVNHILMPVLAQAGIKDACWHATPYRSQ
jgi:integrase